MWWVERISHEKMQEGVHEFDQLTEYCKKNGINPSRETLHNTISFIEDTEDTHRPDYLIYKIDVIPTTPLEKLNIGDM